MPEAYLNRERNLRGCTMYTFTTVFLGNLYLRLGSPHGSAWDAARLGKPQPTTQPTVRNAYRLGMLPQGLGYCHTAVRTYELPFYSRG